MTRTDTLEAAGGAETGRGGEGTVLAIDPGCRESAWCLLRGEKVHAEKVANADLLGSLRGRGFSADCLVVEMVAGSYGAAVGMEIMATACWTGRFLEAWEMAYGSEGATLTRQAVKGALCGTARAGDAHVRQALIDRWGGDSVALAKAARCPACKGRGYAAKSTRDRGVVSFTAGACSSCRGTGRDGADGPLRGLKADQWAALAVAVVYREQRGSVARAGRAE